MFWAKSPLLVPVMAMLVIVSAELPEFVSVTAWAALVVLTTWFPNESEAGERLTGELVPVPVTLAVCGLSLALSVTVRVALRVPVAVGLNVRLIVQLDPAATLEPQLLVCAKSPLLVPVMAMLVIDSAALPEFDRFTA